MTSQHWLAVAFAVGMLLWQFWPAVSGLLGKVKLPAIGGGTSADQDVTDLAALKLVQARFARLGCPEGQAAVHTCFEHFFHEAAKA